MVGAGAVEHSQLVDLAGKAFGGLPSGGPSTEELVAKACPRGAVLRAQLCTANVARSSPGGFGAPTGCPLGVCR